MFDSCCISFFNEQKKPGKSIDPDFELSEDILTTEKKRSDKSKILKAGEIKTSIPEKKKTLAKINKTISDELL